MPDKYTMQKMLAMDISKRELDIIPGEVICDAVEVSVQRIDLSNNKFRQEDAKCFLLILYCDKLLNAILCI